jgi:hypothetical protein
MNPSENPKFEQEWQRLFESASETPPPSAWAAIEKQLDDQEAVIIPLVWWKNPKLLYAAAAVVALLLVSWPILRPGTSPGASENRNEVATKSSPQAVDPASTAGATEVSAASESPATPGKASANPPSLVASDRVASMNEPASGLSEEKADFGKKNPRAEARGLLAGSSPARSQTPASVAQDDTFIAGTPDDNQLSFSSPALTTLPQNSPLNGGSEADSLLTVTAPLPMRSLTRSIAALSPLGPSQVDVYMQKRFVHFRYDLGEPELPKRSRGRELWAGLGIMPASFNPRVNVTSSPVAFTNANASRQALASSSKPQLSYALQMQGGKKLSKRWSVETGVSYLQGNSTFESDGYVLNSFTSRSANVLEDALLSSNGFYTNNMQSSPGMTPSSDVNVGSFIDLDQRTSNNYRYVQVPVQAGYTLNPDGKMNYTVLAGVVSNLFLQNEVQSAQGYSFRNTANDGLYHSLNWSAATGIRINYRLAGHWNASLTGSYQKAIDSILRDNSTLDSRPQLYGVAWGVQYFF